jgi:drug/metabolite transporter (DMT)-like permease
MDLLSYLLGVFFAVLSGVLNNYGTVLQKKVVNKFRENPKFMTSLIKNPLWLFGLILQIIIGGIFFFIAQLYIGPTLIPGLMGAGLIVLAIGSVKIVGEELKLSEIIGIILMVIAIALIGFSNMAIDVNAQNFLDLQLILRIFIFTIVLYALAAVFYFMQVRNIYRGLSLAIYSGFMFALSNFWISPLMGVIAPLFEGLAHPLEIIIFIISIGFLIITNLFGTITIQKSFRVGQASNLIPIQQVPIQIAPVFYFLSVYLLQIPNVISLFFLISGIALVIVSSFLLGKRQTQLEKLEL